ncbi:hypothetical protein F5888DRAFT_505098 [Russula emetica]|nr:hypothetical protein F5888DRAFT_505098 [Russula emetica]
MEHPEVEIERVVQMLVRPASPDVQQAAVRKYFTSNAGFRHPMYSVKPATNSRDGILGIFQWYHVLSRYIELYVDNISYDVEKSILFLDMAQVFHIRCSPFPPARTRLLTRLTLHKEGARYYIAYQEEFFHPDDFFAMIVPPLFKPVNLILRIGGFARGLSARIAQAVFDVWRPRRDD